jgi:short subunit dehydrogenase-like uncharacterized protein
LEKMANRIVVFGATGYTGELVARALVARGARPVLAARSAERLQRLADELGGLEARVADVSRPESVRALVERGDVMLSAVGPFVRWGEPAVQAAIDAGATYLDSTGEPAFIRRIFEQHDQAARAARCALMTAFGFDWVPGNLAGALALREAGPAAVRVEIGYFVHGAGISGGTRASMVAAAIEPSSVFRHGSLVTERASARARTFELAPGKRRAAASVGGSEHFALPENHPALRDVGVFLGMPGAERLPTLSAVLDGFTRLPGARGAVRALAGRFVQGSTGGPDAARRSRSSSTVIAETFSSTGKELTRVKLSGPDGYSFTADILAWAATAALEQGVHGVGALGPVSAFGIEGLEAGVEQAGFQRQGKTQENP